MTARSRLRKAAISSAPELDLAHLQRLAEFRYQVRRFLHISSTAVEQAGLHSQQYQLLQCVCAMPDGVVPTIANVAARMLLKHNSAVELVDRAIVQGLLSRETDPADLRRILLRVTPEGERLLASLAEFHTRELEHSGPELVRALQHVLNAKSKGAFGITDPANQERQAVHGKRAAQ